MKTEPMPIAGAAVIHADPYVDHRGVFARYFCEEEMADLLGPRSIKQVNFSCNLERGTVRGLHYQKSPQDEMKFVRCLRGTIFSVIVDLRRESPTHHHWHAVQLSSETMNMLCVPERCAHGYQCLSDRCELMYFVTSPYVATLQAGLRFDDPALAIHWPIPVTQLSERDARHPLLRQRVQGAVA